VVWLESDGWIAAAPVAGDADEELVAGVCCVAVWDVGVWVVVEVLCSLVTTGVVVEPVAPVVEDVVAGVVMTVDVAAVLDAVGVLDAVAVLDVVAAGGGAGAPGAGGSVEVPGPVTRAPFFAVIPTNAAGSGVWMLPSAPERLPPGPATR